MCELTPGEIVGLAPLLTKLGLAMTVDGVKQLLLTLNSAVGGILLNPVTEGLTSLINNLVVSLLGEPLDLDSIVGSVADVVNKTITCIANPLP